MLDGRRVRQAGVRAAQVLRHAGQPLREAAHVRLVDDGVRPRDVRAGRRRPTRSRRRRRQRAARTARSRGGRRRSGRRGAGRRPRARRARGRGGAGCPPCGRTGRGGASRRCAGARAPAPSGRGPAARTRCRRGRRGRRPCQTPWVVPVSGTRRSETTCGASGPVFTRSTRHSSTASACAARTATSTPPARGCTPRRWWRARADTTGSLPDASDDRLGGGPSVSGPGRAAGRGGGGGVPRPATGPPDRFGV